MYQSIVQQRGDVSFPAFMGERVHMQKFYKEDGLPEALKRWQPTVDGLLEGIDTDLPIYLMIDQANVKAGLPHRRPGLHVDGYWNEGDGWGSDYWNPSKSAHGGHRAIRAHSGRPIRGHIPAMPSPGTHKPFGGGSHTSIQVPSGRGHSGSHSVIQRHSAGSSWDSPDFSSPEGIILASNVTAARAYRGLWEGNIGDGGDCSRVDVSNLIEVPMEAGKVYAGNVAMLHESLPVQQDCQRTVVRLNVPGWTPTH